MLDACPALSSERGVRHIHFIDIFVEFRAILSVQVQSRLDCFIRCFNHLSRSRCYSVGWLYVLWSFTDGAFGHSNHRCLRVVPTHRGESFCRMVRASRTCPGTYCRHTHSAPFWVRDGTPCIIGLRFACHAARAAHRFPFPRSRGS